MKMTVLNLIIDMSGNSVIHNILQKRLCKDWRLTCKEHEDIVVPSVLLQVVK
jgi:hypothetical protein